MKTTKHLWSIVCYAMLLILFSCTEEEVQPPVEGTVTDKNGPISLELTKFTATTATFSGAVNLDLYAQYDEVGIIYSLSETLEIKPLVTTVVPITNIDKNNRYEKQMEDLLYDTKYYYSSYICMNGIYKCGEVQSFTTDDVKITVSEPEVTSTTAIFKGKVELGEEDMESLSFGVAWSKEKDFEKGVVEEMSEINEDGTFAVTVSGLKMDTEYYYATCVGQIDSEYGEVKAFSTASASMTVSATQITQTSVTFEGQAELSPEDDSIEYGILYSTGDELEIGAEGCIRKKLTDIFDADGKYSLKVEGLVNDTKYNYCWYARQGDECKYGIAQEFATASASMTVSATQITQTSVTFEGQAELSPEDDSIEYGILYSTGDELEIGAEGCIRKKLTDIFDADGKYSLKVEGLVNDTKYNYCWYARQGDECKYGTAQEFATASVTINLSVDPITQTTATFKGSYEEPDGEGFEIGLIYSTSLADLATDSETAKVIKLEDSAFSHKVDGLKYNTEYYYCTYICQDGDYKYGTAQSFKTQDVTVELSVNDITQTTATFTGKTFITESSAIEVGILYSTQSSLSMSSYSTTKKRLSNGDFSITAEGLKNNTRYYYKYYIKQGDGYSYGETRDFTTISISATLSKPLVTQTTATFSGNVNFDQTAPIEFGILYSTNNTLIVNTSGVKKVKATPDDNGDFSCIATGLSHSTTYYYCYYSCQDGSYTYGNVSEVTTESVNVNLTADSFTQTTVTFSGNAELTENGVIEVGVLYSTDSELKVGAYDVNKRKLYPDSSGNMSLEAEGLHYNTNYYFCYYIYQNGAYTYGSTQTFKTSDVSVTLSVDSVTQTTATFSGNMELTEDGQIEVGVLYSTGSDLTIGTNGVINQVLTPDSSGSVSFTAEGLQFATTYNYCYYVCQNGKYTNGTPQTFTTSDFPWDSAQDLSINGTANCYIVSKSGLYKVRAVKGNSNTSVTGDSAEILWESFGTSVTPFVGDIVQYVSYKDGYIGFNIHDDFKEGNAVIAAKDADGNILWSWHIWLTDKPQEHVYNNNAGTMMDRNLGATSATSGDVCALGLLYQWGRKDPFLGSSSISSKFEAKSTITWPSTVSSDSSNGTIEYATAHPTTFITHNSNNDDWYYTGSSSTDNTRWTTSSSTKSIYDPCPAGWRVPDGGEDGVWSKALGSSSYFYDDSLYNDTNEGMNFSGKFGDAATIWYPASGYRNLNDGGLGDVGNCGIYWSASPNSDGSSYAYDLYFDSRGYVNPSSDDCRAFGFSVRCLKE